MKHLLKRALAYFIDFTICFAAVMLILQWAILSPIRSSFGITMEWFENSWNMEGYVLLSISLPIWAYFTFLDSNRSKGTFGKRLLKLSVRNADNQKIGLGKSFQRTLLKLLPWEIAHIGVIFPTPIYFEAEPDVRILTIVGSVLFFAYMLSILFNQERKALYDMLIGIKVAPFEGAL